MDGVYWWTQLWSWHCVAGSVQCKKLNEETRLQKCLLLFHNLRLTPYNFNPFFKENFNVKLWFCIIEKYCWFMIVHWFCILR